MTEITADRLVEVYIKIRDARAQLKQDYDKQDSLMSDQMETISAKLLEMCRTTGVESMKTKHGTVMQGAKTRYWTSDWSAFHQFVLAQGRLDLLEKRIAQSELARFREENPDAHIPGLNADSRLTVTVRRS